eukprot:3448129-Rhodomonas_salina.1
MRFLVFDFLYLSVPRAGVAQRAVGDAESDAMRFLVFDFVCWIGPRPGVAQRAVMAGGQGPHQDHFHWLGDPPRRACCPLHGQGLQP